METFSKPADMGHESKRVASLYKTINRAEYSPEINKLWDMVDESNTNVEILEMGESKRIVSSPTDEQEKFIWTFDVSGCFVVLTYSEDQDSNQTLSMSHINPLSISDFKPGQQAFAVANNSQGRFCKALVFTESKPANNLNTGEPDSQRESLTEIIESLKVAGYESSIEVITYQKAADGIDKGIIVATASPQGVASYKTWFSEGTLSSRNSAG